MDIMSFIEGMLPQFFWCGPPLPKMLNVLWPWMAQTEPAPLETSPTPQPAEGTTTYSNAEEITFPDGFDPDTFMPLKIVVHRKAVVR
jgi:hypothetical protein